MPIDSRLLSRKGLYEARARVAATERKPLIALRVACSTAAMSLTGTYGRCATACSKKPRAIGRFAVQQWNYRASVPLGRHSARGGSVDTGLVGLQPLKITNRELCLTGARGHAPPFFVRATSNCAENARKIPMCFRPSQDNSTKVNAEMGQNRSLYIEPELGLLILVITNVSSRALVKLTLGPLVFNALFFTALS